MEADRRHETPVSESKRLLSLTAEPASRMSVCLHQFPPMSTRSPGVTWVGLDGCCTHSGLHDGRERLSLRNLLFIARNAQACSLSWREALPYPSRLLTAYTTMRNPGQRAVGALHSWHPHQDVQEHETPREVCHSKVIFHKEDLCQHTGYIIALFK